MFTEKDKRNTFLALKKEVSKIEDQRKQGKIYNCEEQLDDSRCWLGLGCGRQNVRVIKEIVI
jgi:hypothetical protein